MKVRSIIAALLLLTACNPVSGAGQAHASSEVAYAKQIDVAKIDSTLKSESLDSWVSSPQLHLENVKWRRSDCDIRPDDSAPKRDYPLCVRIDFRRPNGWGWMSLKIGTIQTGIHGRPELLYCVVKSSGFPPQGAFHNVKRLSELPRVLDAVDAEKRGR